MIKRNRILAGCVIVLLVGALSGAAAVADEGVQPNDAAEQAALPLLEAEVEPVETSPPAEAPVEADPADEVELPDARPRPAPRGGPDRGAGAVALSTSAQPGPEDQGQVETDPESAAGACPGGTALKIDNLRSNGTYGPITVSDFTNTSFTWTSAETVSAVLVKDGGGYKTNPGGTSGSASSLGQDISHVIFCLGGDVPEVDAEEPEPCDADETMPGTQPCKPEPCDADETMPGTQPCEPEPCDADEIMPGTQPCKPEPCDADETMPGRQDCTEGVAGAESGPKKSEGDDDDVQGAGLASDDEPDSAPLEGQAVQPAVEGASLPFTGGGVFPLLLVAFGLATAGGGAVLIKRP
jgi:hypothetical protein